MGNIKKNVIGNSINTLLAQQGKRQKDLAKALGVTDNTVSYYCSGARRPNYSQLITIADFFGVSVDALLGHSTSQSDADKELAICNYTGLSIQALGNIKEDPETASAVIGSKNFSDLLASFCDFSDHVGIMASFIRDIEAGNDPSYNAAELRKLLAVAKYEKYTFVENCSAILNEICNFDSALESANRFLHDYREPKRKIDPQEIRNVIQYLETRLKQEAPGSEEYMYLEECINDFKEMEGENGLHT